MFCTYRTVATPPITFSRAFRRPLSTFIGAIESIDDSNKCNRVRSITSQYFAASSLTSASASTDYKCMLEHEKQLVPTELPPQCDDHFRPLLPERGRVCWDPARPAAAPRPNVPRRGWLWIPRQASRVLVTCAARSVSPVLASPPANRHGRRTFCMLHQDSGLNGLTTSTPVIGERCGADSDRSS